MADFPSVGEYRELLGAIRRDLASQLNERGQPGEARQDLRVRTYCPVGDLVAGMAYLVRRLLENTSNESFLHEQARGAALDDLLARPVASTAA